MCVCVCVFVYGLWCVCVCVCVCVCISMGRWDLDGEVREELEIRLENPPSTPLAPTQVMSKNVAVRVSFTHVFVSVCLTFRGFRKDLMAGILSIRWRMRRRRRAFLPQPAPPCNNMFSLELSPLSLRARVRFRENMFLCLGEDLEA